MSFKLIFMKIICLIVFTFTAAFSADFKEDVSEGSLISQTVNSEGYSLDHFACEIHHLLIQEMHGSPMVQFMGLKLSNKYWNNLFDAKFPETISLGGVNCSERDLLFKALLNGSETIIHDEIKQVFIKLEGYDDSEKVKPEYVKQLGKLMGPKSRVIYAISFPQTDVYDLINKLNSYFATALHQKQKLELVFLYNKEPGENPFPYVLLTGFKCNKNPFCYFVISRLDFLGCAFGWKKYDINEFEQIMKDTAYYSHVPIFYTKSIKNMSLEELRHPNSIPYVNISRREVGRRIYFEYSTRHIDMK